MRKLYFFFYASLFLLFIACRHDPMASMPNFAMVLPDNGGLFYTGNLPKDSAVMFVHFDPDCKGCQDEAALLKANAEEFKSVRIFFLSVKNWEDIRYFRDYFKLGEQGNIRFGRDIDTTLARHFKTVTTPMIALYDRHKELKAVIEGNSDLQRLMATIKKIQ